MAEWYLDGAIGVFNWYVSQTQTWHFSWPRWLIMIITVMLMRLHIQYDPDLCNGVSSLSTKFSDLMDTIVICEGSGVFSTVKARVPKNVVPCIINDMFVRNWFHHLPDLTPHHLPSFQDMVKVLCTNLPTHKSTSYFDILPSQYLGAVDKSKHVCLKVGWLQRNFDGVPLHLCKKWPRIWPWIEERRICPPWFDGETKLFNIEKWTFRDVGTFYSGMGWVKIWKNFGRRPQMAHHHLWS